nr:PQQ-dependent sugar dehydrogenase [Desulfobacterales bacterium]
MKAAACILGFLLAGALPAPAADAYNLFAWLSARLAPQELPRLASSADTFRVEAVAEGLESPWAVVPAPDGRLFITERPGRLRVVKNGALLPAPLPGVPPVAYRGQGGLLDMTLHPDYEQNRQLYLAYTADTSQGMLTRVAR